MSKYKFFLDFESFLENNNKVKLTPKQEEDFSFLRKDPKYLKIFLHMHEVEGEKISDLKELYASILSSKNTLSQKNIDLTAIYDAKEVEKIAKENEGKKERKKTHYKEKIVDILMDIKLTEKANKFSKLLPKIIRDDIRNTKIYFDRFKNIIVDYSYAQFKNFTRVVSRYKTVEDFLNNLEEDVNKTSGTDVNKIIDILYENESLADVVYYKDNIIAARIYSKQISIACGSNNWCITYNNAGSWDDYVSGDRGGESPGIQYFIWDFNKDSTDIESLIGITIYKDGSVVGSYKNNSSIKLSSVKKEPWFPYLTGYNKLTTIEKIKLVGSNPKLEKQLNVIGSLSNAEKRSFIEQVPGIIRFMSDLSFITPEESMALIEKDNSLANYLPIVDRLSDIQKTRVVLINPRILYENKFKEGENPYISVINNLPQRDVVNMIMKDYKLFPVFNEHYKMLDSKSRLEIITKKPDILVIHPNIIKRHFDGKSDVSDTDSWMVDIDDLRELYKVNKEDWISIFNKAPESGSNKITVRLILTQLAKSPERLQFERERQCYIFNIDTNSKIGELDNIVSNILYVSDITNASSSEISSIKMMSMFKNNIQICNCWIPIELIDKHGLKGQNITMAQFKKNDNEYNPKFIDLIKYITENKKNVSKQKVS